MSSDDELKLVPLAHKQEPQLILTFHEDGSYSQQWKNQDGLRCERIIYAFEEIKFELFCE